MSNKNRLYHWIRLNGWDDPTVCRIEKARVQFPGLSYDSALSENDIESLVPIVMIKPPYTPIAAPSEAGHYWAIVGTKELPEPVILVSYETGLQFMAVGKQGKHKLDRATWLPPVELPERYKQ
jgi:hypothetical protein